VYVCVVCVCAGGCGVCVCVNLFGRDCVMECVEGCVESRPVRSRVGCILLSTVL
jgi:hypothetical protein